MQAFSIAYTLLYNIMMLGLCVYVSADLQNYSIEYKF